MSPRKTSDERAFQTTQFRRLTLPIGTRAGTPADGKDLAPTAPATASEVGKGTLELLEKVIWPEPLEHLLPPDEWAADAPEPDEEQRETNPQYTQGTSTPTLVDNLSAGMVIDGRYQVLDQLGAGGMARILKVRHTDLGRTFALKIIHAGRITDDRYRKILLREARVISQLEHPNIVQVTDFGADPNVGVFIVMEYLKGETVFDRLMDGGKMKLPVALDIVLQAAEALRYMHTDNIVHRDIKPENIFLVRPPEGQRQVPVVKLIDFGLSGPDAKATFKASSGVVGTPAYMAPEQIQGLAPRASMDIYALGILLYELLTGRPPFVGKLDEIIAAHVMDVPPAPSNYLDEPLDAAVEALILKSLAKRPDERQGSMQELVYELRTLMDMLGFGRGRGRRSRKAAAGEDKPVLPEQMVFEATQTPLFLLDAKCKVVAANPSMAKFMRLPVKSLIGTSLVDSRLTDFYPELKTDLELCMKLEKGSRRLVRIPRDPEPAAEIMFWLSPIRQGDGEPPWVSGFIVPFLCSGDGGLDS